MADSNNEQLDLAPSDTHEAPRTGGDQVDSVAYTCSALSPTPDFATELSYAEYKARSQANSNQGAPSDGVVSFIPEVVTVDWLPDGSFVLLGRSPLYFALDEARIEQEYDQWLRGFFVHNLALD